MVEDKYNKHVWVGVSSVPKIISYLIRKETKSKYSHAWLSFYDKSLKKRVVIEANSKGYVMSTWDRWIRKHRKGNISVFSSYRLPLERGIWSMADYLGEPYDFKGVFWFLLRRWIKKPWVSPRRLKCSEAVAIFLKNIGANGAEYINAEAVHPGDIYKYLIRSHEFVKIEVVS